MATPEGEELIRPQDSNHFDDEPPWPSTWEEPPLPVRLRDALEHNDFSSIPIASLPVAVPQIAKAAHRSPDELLVESLGFSIMSRNRSQIHSTLDDLYGKEVDVTSIYPLHMAVNYLDGYKTCCNILSRLIVDDYFGSELQEMYVNELGHTVLDSLMMSVLKSHSSTSPGIVDTSYKNTARFAGEEVDICGRWDADSPCVRQLYADGVSTTPITWKHKFCHTSIQAVCHSMVLLSNNFPGRLKDTASGLYVRRCFDCGKKLELLPLHSLVMTTFHLASNGCPGEDLFGALACLLCLLSCGADPESTADVSVAALLQMMGTDSMEVVCDHEEVTPALFAERISGSQATNLWSEEVKVGWVVFCGVLRVGENACAELQEPTILHGYQLQSSESDPHILAETQPNYELRETHHGFHRIPHCLRKRKDLATLWASVQAELLSYRRVDYDMGWISSRFSMEQLKHQLASREPLSVGYAEQNLLQPHCICGSFNVYSRATLSDAMDPNLANIDVWGRATYGVMEEQ